MVTFKVSKHKPSVYHNSYRSAQSPLPDHYLKYVLDYSRMGCGEVLQETDWKAARTDFLENGFVSTVLLAYNGHHNLVLRPDDVWLAIVVQFASFVNGNAEELRHFFVSHEGKKDLVVSQDGTVSSASYSQMALQFVDQLRQNIKDPDLADWILPDFTTTTDNDTIVSSVVMMATMKKYFDYKFLLSCGIPEVTLLGTVEDWQKLAARSDKLRSFGKYPRMWAGMLQGVLRQFVAAAQGNADIGFWERICSNHGGGCGDSYISGWITAFCVFDSEGHWQGGRRAKVGCFRWFGGGSATSGYPNVYPGGIPPGHVTVPVTISDNGTECKAVMFAGHMLTELVSKTTLTPKATWAIVRLTA